MKLTGRRLMLWGAVLAVAAFSVQLFTGSPVLGQKAAEPAPGPVAELTAVKLKFDGAASCNASGCHGEPAPKEKGESFLNEWTLWHGRKEPHHNATGNLSNAKGKAIAKTLKITDAAKDARCINCHSLDVPAALQGKNFTIREGVTCTSCHGPSEKWLSKHSTVGWLDGERKANPDHQKLFETWGLFDTKPLVERSRRCTSCHLKIDPDLVAAGHPQPTFEMVSFSENYAERHWHDKEGYELVRLWAAGQVAAAPEALDQVAERAAIATTKPDQLTEAYNEAMAHYFVLKPLLASGALKGDAAGITASATKLAAAIKAKDSKSLGTVASAMSASIRKLAPGIPAYAPDKKSVSALLKSLAGASASGYGDPGIEQQGDAMFALTRALATSTDSTAADKALADDVGKTLAPWKKKVAAADFDKALKAEAAKLK